MKLTHKVRAELAHYRSEPPSVQVRLAQMLSHGKIGGSGKLVILPVDQGFEHGPATSFAENPPSYDPLYHWKLAVDAKLSAFAAPLGLLEIGAIDHAAEIPSILKLNSATALEKGKDQAFTSSPKDALRLGCAAVGMTLYPGADKGREIYEEAREAIAEARSLGLASVLWSYPRGGDLAKEDETALDVIAYAAHIAALLGAHIIKVKPPAAHLSKGPSAAAYKSFVGDIRELEARVRHVREAAFAGRRLLLFSGGATRDEDELLAEIRACANGGASGAIVGRNVFQRPRTQALALLDDITAIYQGK